MIHSWKSQESWW